MNDAKIIDITDTGLLDSVRKNNQAAFKELYLRYWPHLYIYSYNILHDKEICEDIIQEIFFDLWTRRNSIRIENPSAYLFQAVKFQIFKQFRLKKLLNLHSDCFIDFLSENNIESSIEYKELNSQIEKLISALPEQRKIIYKMSREEELSNQEIADKLNISIQTVKNQISSALKSIRKALNEVSSFIIL